MKSTYRDKITRLKQDALEKLSKRDQVISALRGQMETKMQATFIAEVSFRSEEIVVQRAMGVTERHYRKVETKLYAQICKTEELERGLEKRMRLQQEKENDWKNVENALCSVVLCCSVVVMCIVVLACFAWYLDGLLTRSQYLYF